MMRMSTPAFANESRMSRKDSLLAFASVSPILNLFTLAVEIRTERFAFLIFPIKNS